MKWQTKMHEAGLKALWTWQEDTLHAWKSKDTVWAFFPVGGGRGICGLLAALSDSASTRSTLLVGPDTDWLSQRLSQATALDIPVVVWDGVSAWPDAPLILAHHSVLDESSSLQNIPLSAVRIVVDRLSPQTEIPAWWHTLSVVPCLFLPTSDHPTSWWHSLLAEHSTWAVIRPPVEHREIQWHEATPEASALEQSSTCFVVSSASESPNSGDSSGIPIHIPDPESVLFREAPRSFRQLGILARRCSSFYLPTPSAPPPHHRVPETEQAWLVSLRRWLQNRVQETSSSILYTSSSELLQALGQPLTPQPVFERGIRELETVLEQLQSPSLGCLRRVEKVCFQVKIHNTQKWQPLFLQDFPELLRFYEAYQTMLQGLPGLEALKLSLKARQQIDLRELAARMPYDVSTLHRWFREMQDKKLATLELHAAPEHQRTDQEYQLECLEQKPTDAGLSWWQLAGEHRTALLWAAQYTGPYPRQDTLERLLHTSPRTLSFWESVRDLWQTASSEQVLLWAGQVLRRWESPHHPSYLALWESISATLGISGIGPSLLLGVLPEAQDVATSSEIAAWIKPLLDRYQHHPNLSLTWYDYVLAMPAELGFQTWIAPYLQQKSTQILQRTSAEQHNELQQYVRLAQQMQATDSDKTDAVSQTESGQSSDATKPYPEQPWSLAVGWALYLLQQPQQAWRWIESTVPTTPVLARICASIAIKANQPEAAQPWSTQAAEGGYPVSSDLLSNLHRQLFSVCKAQSRCKRCPLYRTAYCPEDVLQHTDKPHTTIPESHREYLVAKRIRANLEHVTSEGWRKMLSSPLAQQSERITRALLQHLAESHEATLDELRQLAQWAESYGDLQHAQIYREEIRKQDSADAHNLQKLADLYIREENIVAALNTALAATHAHPRKYPLELWLQQHQAILLQSPQPLRQALLELPAHPAFSSLEQELTALENINRELKPILEQAETAMSQELWGEAQRLAQQALDRYPQQAPARFRQILDDAKLQENQLWQTLRNLPKIPQDRNKILEELATTAKKHGLHKLSDASYRKLLQLNPQYGLGYLKWARTTHDPEQRQEAYEKALTLSRTPAQMKQNLEEYIQTLEQNHDLPRILPKLLEWASHDGEELFPPNYLEKLFLRLLQQYGTQDSVAGPIREFLQRQDKGKAYKRLLRSMEEFDKMEPWKRALLSIKSQE